MLIRDGALEGSHDEQLACFGVCKWLSFIHVKKPGRLFRVYLSKYVAKHRLVFTERFKTLIVSTIAFNFTHALIGPPLCLFFGGFACDKLLLPYSSFNCS